VIDARQLVAALDDGGLDNVAGHEGLDPITSAKSSSLINSIGLHQRKRNASYVTTGQT
jgi:hypothetical protein